MKKNLLFSNKNIFAFVLCFVAFTAQADDSIETTHLEEMIITIKKDGEITTMTAIVVTLEQATELLTMILGEDEAKKIDIKNGMTFTERGLSSDEETYDFETFYVVRDQKSEDEVNLTVTMTVNVENNDLQADESNIVAQDTAVMTDKVNTEIVTDIQDEANITIEDTTVIADSVDIDDIIIELQDEIQEIVTEESEEKADDKVTSQK